MGHWVESCYEACGKCSKNVLVSIQTFAFSFTHDVDEVEEEVVEEDDEEDFQQNENQCHLCKEQPKVQG